MEVPEEVSEQNAQAARAKGAQKKRKAASADSEAAQAAGTGRHHTRVSAVKVPLQEDPALQSGCAGHSSSWRGTLRPCEKSQHLQQRQILGWQRPRPSPGGKVGAAELD